MVFDGKFQATQLFFKQPAHVDNTVPYHSCEEVIYDNY